MIKKGALIITLFVATGFNKTIAMHTALHDAVLRNDESGCERMLKDKACPDAVTSNGCTALHLAAKKGNLNIVNLILRAAPDTLLRNNNGRTAYDEAVLSGHDEVAASIGNYNVSYMMKKYEPNVVSIGFTMIFSCFKRFPQAERGEVASVEPSQSTIQDTNQEANADDTRQYFSRISTGPQ